MSPIVAANTPNHWETRPSCDDGVGGADSRKGTGLIGLADRVQALSGHIQVMSPIGRGTSLQITIPLTAGSTEGQG